jgi:glutamate/tyrosine decarboxylase-like PLP-dependent enzyme
MHTIIQAPQSLEPNAQERGLLQHTLDAYLSNFLATLPQQKAFVDNRFDKELLDENFEIEGETNAFGELLNLLKERVDNTGLNPASGGHLGYIPGGGIFSAALGDYLAAVTNRYATVFYASPGAVRIENALVRWAGNVIGYPKGFGGSLTSGGSMANLTALVVAKQAQQIKSRDVENAVIYTTKQSHHSIFKAIKIIGLEECIVRHISLDEHFRMCSAELEKQILLDRKQQLTPFLIIANAGSTDVGAVDPLNEIADIAQNENCWLHVDGAYGGFFNLTEHGKAKLKGIERADSLILDPHKTLFLPYGSGIVLLKETKHLKEAFSYDASYMQDTLNHHQEISPTEISPELSRNFRGMRLWIALKLHGVQAFIDYQEEKIALSNYLYRSLQEIGFYCGNQPDLSTFIFRFKTGDDKKDDTINRDILKKIHADGRIFISSTQVNKQFWLRASILSFRTHQKEVDTLLEMLKNALT